MSISILSIILLVLGVLIGGAIGMLGGERKEKTSPQPKKEPFASRMEKVPEKRTTESGEQSRVEKKEERAQPKTSGSIELGPPQERRFGGEKRT